jgi:GMP synthase-like glutamine amidotransferase
MMIARRRALATIAGAIASPLVATSATRRARAAPIGDEAQKSLALPGVEAAPSSMRERSQVMYVIIDRPEDALPADHDPNLRGLSAVVAGWDPAVKIVAVTIDDLLDLGEAAIDDTWSPLAIFSAGSFTEWFMYGVDFGWRRRLDHYMSLLRTLTIPTLAVCGSHQLVALAFNGFGAVAHMTNAGKPVRIADELAASMPSGMWPSPRVGEEGTYPIVATSAAENDPVARTTSSAPMAAAHHKDMVIETSGFTLLYRGDESRPAATRARDQVEERCQVQALKLDDPGRLLYTTQFHPEMCAFDESDAQDAGFGKSFVAAFLQQARGWWSERQQGSPTG